MELDKEAYIDVQTAQRLASALLFTVWAVLLIRPWRGKQA
jgi:hypothetical protein